MLMAVMGYLGQVVNNFVKQNKLHWRDTQSRECQPSSFNKAVTLSVLLYLLLTNLAALRSPFPICHGYTSGVGPTQLSSSP